MADKIINQENLAKARELLRSVRIKDSYGELHQIGFISFQSFTDKQAEKKGDEALEHRTAIKKTEKWGKTFYNLNASVHIEKEPTTTKESEAIELLLQMLKDSALPDGVAEIVKEGFLS